jgi:hypothetical protein
MKESGIGRENGIEAFEACESHLLAMPSHFSLTTWIRRFTEQVHHREYLHHG